MGHVRPAAVAGMFYPADPLALTRELESYFASVPVWAGPVPKAIIAPHAGTVYSGPIAARAYARLTPAQASISRVVLVGPSHRVAFHGIAASSAAFFDTPLGRIPIDRSAIDSLLAHVPGTGILDAAHAAEHSLEVHLPFLQMMLDRFVLVPLVVGDADPALVAQALDTLWGGPETLIVVSSDLSHYLDYAAARAADQRSCAAIEQLDAAALLQDQACGCIPIRGLLTVAKRRGLCVETIDLRNSGDTAGPRDRVVGYGAWAFTAPAAGAEDSPEAALHRHAATLLEIAHANIESMLTSGHPAPPATDIAPLLRGDGASFVTLRRDGDLRGCIGSATAWRALADDVADNAIKAAFADPRFPPLTPAELDGLDISVSVLTPPQPMTITGEADLLAQLRPGQDGLIIADGERSALFLPSVWEVLPDPAEFLAQLKRKAGMRPDHGSSRLTAQRFSA
ncbi:MAG TPA: AmmeMemoRadiSam system protein B, partial [Patescibacteria group bacterium]|nr:AmmeMemoRadiSam system protein B [Patescibacteria group bacterium]